MNLKGRNFLKLLDFTPEEIQYLLDLAADFKRQKKNGQRHDDFYGKNIALIFEKTSTRTRCSFEVAAHDLRMNATYPGPLWLADWQERIHRRYRSGSGADV